MKTRSVVVSAALVLGSAALIMSACGSDEDVAQSAPDGGDENVVGGDSGGTTDTSTTTDAGASDGSCADADPDASAIDCTGKCGPVKDPCTGHVRQCGGCTPETLGDGGVGPNRVCDLATNSCTLPKTTCTALGAECGTVKDSCGNYLDCPDTNPKGCAAGKECDPDTHACKDCQPVTCKDLGFECGFAWLGCGQDVPANHTDCGGCAPAGDGGTRVCNAVFHVCEPQCTPKTAPQLCADAKTKRGVECGVISNGCGGTVSCDSVAGFGCAAGESCGVRGIANRCDKKQPPDECKALGKNCGTIKSACTGLDVSCGDCPTGEVCNANGVCGKPCTPKTCAVDFVGKECGTFDDGCGSTVKCGNCASGVCNQTTNTCCAASTCAANYPGKCGNDLANGCGSSSLDCVCPNGTTCTVDGGAAPAPAVSVAGMCCAPKTAASYQSAGQCGTNLPNGCGQNNVTVSCGAGKECVNNATGSAGPAPPNGTPGTCCTRTDTCNNAPNCSPVQNSCRPAGTTVACNTVCSGGQTCNGGTCCQGAPACPGNGGENAECNTVKTPVDPGCGSNRTCVCAGSRVCWCGTKVCGAGDGAGQCKTALTCATGYPGQCGTALSNGVGGTINCGCGAGKVCSSTTAGVPGTCACNNPTNAPYTCANVPNGPGQAGGDACGTFDNGCGGTINCTCTTGLVCNTAANPNVCCAPAVCPTPALGSQCGQVTNGCTTVSCGCPSGAGNENFTCTAGTCQCVKDTCRGRTGPQPDRCGGTLPCGG